MDLVDKTAAEIEEIARGIVTDEQIEDVRTGLAEWRERHNIPTPAE